MDEVVGGQVRRVSPPEDFRPWSSMPHAEAMERGGVFWTPDPQFFKDRKVFIVGGGPSLRDMDLTGIEKHGVIVINVAFQLVPTADVLFFHDANIYEANREAIDLWPGLAVTASRQSKAESPSRFRRIHLVDSQEFCRGGIEVRYGRSSGHTAISLAIAMGAQDIILLGYDMKRAPDGRSNFHDQYGQQDDRLYSHEFLPSFHGWYEASCRAGVSVRNATPGSALTEFPRAILADVLME